MKLRAAQRRLAEEKARKMLHLWATDPDQEPIDPFKALVAEATRTQQHVERLQERIQKEDPEALIWVKSATEAGSGSHYGAGPFASISHEAKPSVLLTLYQEERAKLVHICMGLVKLGLDERQVRIGEAQVVLLVAVLQKVLASPELGLDTGRQARGQELLAEALDPS